MGLNGYRAFRDTYIDNGVEVLEILEGEFSPDFRNRDTSQVWDVSNHSDVMIESWKGVTLTERTLHELTIVNNGGTDCVVSFSKNYVLVDEENANLSELNKITIQPTKTAYFYATAILYKGLLTLELRTGSQDSRNS